GQHLEGAPSPRRELALRVGERRDLLPHTLRVPTVGDPREPLQLRKGKPERLADVTDRSPRPVGGEARDERGMLVSVALADGHDQLLADVAWEVEIDVGDGFQLPVEETSEREVVLHRIDVGQPGQVADDRADRAAATATG